MAQVINAIDANFDQEVKKSDVPVLVDFWAPWCGPCRMQSPVLDELASEYGEQVKFVKVNVDDNPDKAGELGISSIPALLLFNGGELKERMIGLHKSSQLREVIDKHSGN